MPLVAMVQSDMKFLVLQFGTPSAEYLACLKAHPEVVVVCTSNQQNRLGNQRALVHEMMTAEVSNPVVFAQMYQLNDKEEFQLEAAADMGALMMDGLTDGIWLMNKGQYQCRRHRGYGLWHLAGCPSAHLAHGVYQLSGLWTYALRPAHDDRAHQGGY